MLDKNPAVNSVKTLGLREPRKDTSARHGGHLPSSNPGHADRTGQWGALWVSLSKSCRVSGFRGRPAGTCRVSAITLPWYDAVSRGCSSIVVCECSSSSPARLSRLASGPRTEAYEVPRGRRMPQARRCRWAFRDRDDEPTNVLEDERILPYDTCRSFRGVRVVCVSAMLLSADLSAYGAAWDCQVFGTLLD